MIDTHDATQPKTVAQASLAPCSLGTALAVADPMVYVVCYDSGAQTARLNVIDVHDPAQPNIRGSVVLSGFGYAVQVANSTAFVAAGAAGVHSVDIHDPVSPTLRTTLDTAGNALDLQVIDTTAFVADDSGLRLLDVHDPAQLMLRASVDTPGSMARVRVMDGYAYTTGGANVALGGRDLSVVDVRQPAQPQVIGTWDEGCSTYAAQRIGDLVYLAAGERGLAVIDIHDPQHPMLRGRYVTPGPALGLDVVGDLAYLADSSGVQIVDIHDPQHPTLRGSIEPLIADCYGRFGVCQAYDLQVVGNYAFVAYGIGGLRVVDVSDPAQPRVLPNFVPGNAARVQVADQRAYLAAEPAFDDAFVIADVHDPNNTRQLGIAPTIRAYSLAVVGERVYSTPPLGVQIIDVHDPLQPVVVNSLALPATASDIAVVNDMVYVADQAGGLQILRVRSAAQHSVFLPVVLR